MEDDLAAPNRGQDTLEAAQVPLDDLDVLGHVEQVASVSGREVVEHTYVVSTREEGVDEM